MDYSSYLNSYHFILNPNPKTKYPQKYKITILDTTISFIGQDSDGKPRVVYYSDIYGIKLIENGNGGAAVYENGDASSDKPSTPRLDIHYLPSVKALFRKGTRKKTTLSVAIACEDLELKSRDILNYIRERLVTSVTSTAPLALLQRSKPILILVNPQSGKCMANKMMREKVAPFLKDGDVSFEVKETEYAGYGTELMRTIELEDYSGVVVFSGDGLLYEVFQGLLARDSSGKFLNYPVGILPGGSGNALACSINYKAGESVGSDILVSSLYILLKHSLRPMDLVEITTRAGRAISFLSVTWGFVADVDIESERFRKLGSARFTVEGVAKILKPKYYKCKLYFKPIYTYSHKTRAKTDSDIVDKQPGSDAGKTTRTRSMMAMRSDEMSGYNQTEPVVVTPSNEESNTLQPPNEESSILLPPLDEPVPSDWHFIEDQFLFIVAAYQTHLNPEFIAAPEATFDDGKIYLILIRAPITRMQILSILSQAEDGTYVKNPLVEVIPVHAFRLVPEGEKGHIVVDGEEVDYGPIQAKVLPRASLVMSM